MIFLILFLISLVTVVVMVPLTVDLAHKTGAIDLPGGRKVHGDAVPRLGGLALVLGMEMALLAATVLTPEISELVTHNLSGMLAGLLIITGLGLWDDIRGARPWLKLLVQLVAAGTAVGLGIQFELASNPFVTQMRDYFDLGWAGIPLTLLWIVFLTNAMNLIDGLDGLASGIALFTSATLFLISIQDPGQTVSFFYIAIAGACLGFLRYNRFPARVFLGDTGSMTLGFSLACLSVAGSQKSFTLSSFMIPVIIFGIPILDSILALVRRYLRRTSLTRGDREHIHHRLIDLGLTHRQAVLTLYFVTILLGIIAFAFTIKLDQYAALVVSVIGILGGLLARELNLFGTASKDQTKRAEWEAKGQGNAKAQGLPKSEVGSSGGEVVLSS